MKFALKSLVAAAAFVAVGAASAQNWTFVSGSGGLTFSGDALSALSASGSSVLTAATIPTIAGLDISGATNTALYSKETGNVSLKFSNAVVNGSALSSLQADNSFVQIRRTTFNDDESTTTRSIFLTNFDVNLANSSISANLYSRLNTGALVSYGKQTIFAADLPGVVGGTQGLIVADSATSGHASGSLNGSLRMTATTANTILSDLGLSTAATDPVAILVRTANWGSTQASGVFSAVPEPSTYAMFGVGMLAVGVMARRRRQAAQA